MLRKSSRAVGGLLLGFALALAADGAASAQSERPKVEPPGGEVLDMSKHMSGSVGQVGQFPGKLVCLRSKESFAPLSAAECASGERVYALEMKDEQAMRPIEAGSKEVEAQLPAMVGKTVLVQGQFHNNTGLLVAASIQEKPS